MRAAAVEPPLRFFSRIEILILAAAAAALALVPLVSEGQTSLAGETVIAELRAGATGPSFRVG